MSYNEENLRRYMPHLFADAKPTTTSVTNSSAPKQQKQKNTKSNERIQPVVQSDPNAVTIDYIIEEAPKTSVVREYFREKLEAISAQNDQDDKEFLQGLEQC